MATMDVGSIDDEIRLAKVKLYRAVEIQASIEENPNDPEDLRHFELAEVHSENEKTPGADKDAPEKTTKKKRVISKRAHYHDLIDRYLMRIGQLEKIRSELMGGAASETPEEIARQIRELVITIDASVTGPS